MNRRMLVGPLAAVALAGLRPAVLAADAKEKDHTYGHATFTFNVSCTADVAIQQPDGGSGHDTLTIKLTETQECQLERWPGNPLFACNRLLSWRNTVSAGGGGKLVHPDNDPPPDTWHYEAKQLDKDVGSWFQGGSPAHPDYDWSVCLEPFLLGGVSPVRDTGSGRADALSFLGIAFINGALGGEAQIEALLAMKPVPPTPLEWRFLVPEGLEVPTTFTGQRTFTSTTSDDPDVSGSATITVDYNFHFVPPGCTEPEPEKPKVELQEIDQKWLPEEDNSLTATANVTGDKPATAFRFTLYDVSKEPGVCCNSDDDNTDPDLAFAPDQGDWTITQDGDQRTAESGTEGKSASIEIASHDWGAWGKLKAQAKIEGKWEPAKVAGSGLDYVRLPYDDDDDHIADAWQEEKSVADQAAEADEDPQPEGQANDGDGVSVYEEYRGFYVSDGGGGRDHKRLDPRTKDFFAIDEGRIFDTAAWEQASGMTAHLLRPDMAKPGADPEVARVVNFRSGNAHTGSKYAVVVHKIDDSGAAAQRGAQNWECGETNGGISSPKDVQYCRVYVDRIRRWVEDVATRLRVAVAEPNSPDAQTFEQSGFPRWMWKAALAKMGEDTIEKLTQQNVRWTAVHEVGHCCGLPGHSATPDAPETSKGNAQCFMCYTDDGRNMQYIILQTLFKPNAAQPLAYDQFCRDADYNCWGRLSVKDN